VVGQRRPAIDAQGLTLVADVQGVAGGAVQPQPGPALLIVVTDKADRQGVGVVL